MFSEQSGSNNTMNIQNGPSTILPGDEMVGFLEQLRNLTEGYETQVVEEAEKSFRNKDQQGLIAKLKMLSKKTLDIAKGIAESIAGGILLEWFKTNGIF